jgi:23S rRNA (adenine2503-C2)-methyltransferase
MSKDTGPLGLYELTRQDAADLLSSLGQPRYRVDQLWDGLYNQHLPIEEISNLPSSLRERLAAEVAPSFAVLADQTGDGGATRKWLFSSVKDGAQAETVLMRYQRRATVCVSSQAGCAMACSFCATGQAGFDRHLTSGEIVEQVVVAARNSPQRVSNVVFMGMGEPLANVDAVTDALGRLNQDLGIGARHLTVSTIGVVPGILALADFELPVTLAVSVHAGDDKLRESLVPLQRRYPLTEVLQAADEFRARRGRRVTYEYAMIAGVNDSLNDAVALADKLVRYGGHVNLIPYNPTPGLSAEATPPAKIAAFAARLEAAGLTATVRRNRGVGIDAACGQLRNRIQPG